MHLSTISLTLLQLQHRPRPWTVTHMRLLLLLSLIHSFTQAMEEEKTERTEVDERAGEWVGGMEAEWMDGVWRGSARHWDDM